MISGHAIALQTKLFLWLTILLIMLIISNITIWQIPPAKK